MRKTQKNPRRKRHPDLDKIIGLNLRNLRVRAGLNQTQLGHALEVSFQQIQKYELGYNRLSVSTMYVMSKVLRCDPMEFLAALDVEETVTGYSKNQVEMLRIYESIHSEQVRRSVKSVLKTYAGARNHSS